MAPAAIAVKAASMRGRRGAARTYHAITHSVVRLTPTMSGVRIVSGIQRVKLNAVSRFSTY